MARMGDEVSLTPRQLLLMEIRDRLCGRNSAELARRINKDPTYINRLFYPADKKGHKGLGLEIMEACSREFFLPPGFWDRTPPALSDVEVDRLRQLRELRNEAVHLKSPDAPQKFIAGVRDLIASELKVDPDTVMREDVLARVSGRVMGRLRELKQMRPEVSLDLLERPVLSVFPRAAEPAPSYGLQPILSWQHEDELPPGEFVMVPRLDVHLSAGPGNGTTQVEIQFNEQQPQAFRADWVRQQHFKPKKLAAMTASGDSMEPTIHDGDSLLIDTSQTEVVDGRVYALWYDGGERVKRLFRLPGAGLRIESDNPRHRAIELGPEYLGHVRVIGRAVHRSGTGGL